jgi:glycosyltransferase involved in cell wall biosynthesis
MKNPLVSICIPYYETENSKVFLKRAIDSLRQQTYKNWELIVTEDGTAAKNHNSAIRQATGDLIKILHTDDYFTHEKALENIVKAFTTDTKWLITGCSNNLNPMYMGDIHLGNNKLGAPSVLTIRKGEDVWFDENLVWLFDCDFYKRMYMKYGEPKIINGDHITIGEGAHQATNRIVQKQKDMEVFEMQKRYHNV